MQRLHFTPVPLKARHDGWTPDRQVCFIEQLAATQSLTKACAAVGMSRVSAYKLRAHPDAAEFRSAWEKALQPDFVAERAPASHARHRLRRVTDRRKVYKVEEMEGLPLSFGRSAATSSALKTLETCLAHLRALDEELVSPQGG